jgi:hypothetical protein
MADLLFYCKTPMNAVMFERPLRRLVQNDRLNIRFCGENRSGTSAASMVQGLGFDYPVQAGTFLAKWKRWDVHLSADIHRVARRARRSIQIFHGVSFKGRMYSPAILKFTDLFLVGDDMRRRYIEKGLFEKDSPSLHRIGMPKLDAFFDGSLDRESTLVDMGVDPARPVILYAPTWRPESSLYGTGLEFIRNCAKQDRFTLIIKLHDWTLEPATNPIDWRTAGPELESEHVRFSTCSNIVSLLNASDVLISDASSVANEYLLLDRPIIWLDAPDLLDKYNDTIHLDGWGRKTGRIVEDEGACMEACLDALRNPVDFSRIRQKAAKDIFYNPGTASERFCEKLYQLLGIQG